MLWRHKYYGIVLCPLVNSKLCGRKYDPSKTSETIYQWTWCNIPQCCNIQQHCYENLTSQTKLVTTTLQTWHDMPQFNTMKIQSMQVRRGHAMNQNFFFIIVIYTFWVGGLPIGIYDMYHLISICYLQFLYKKNVSPTGMPCHICTHFHCYI